MSSLSNFSSSVIEQGAAGSVSITDLGPVYQNQVIGEVMVPQFRIPSHENFYSERAMRKASEAGQPSEIIQDFLYLSGADTAANGDLLASNNITHIINISPCRNFYDSGIPNSLSQKYPNWKPPIYLRLYVHDGPRENIERFFNASNMFIHEAGKMGGRVLVHCWAGVSRSASLILAFLMNQYELSYRNAFIYVKIKRPIISPNWGFNIQLKKYEIDLMIALGVSEMHGETEYFNVVMNDGISNEYF